jgi:acetyltransferase
VESKEVLAAYQFPVTPTQIADNAAAAVALADKFGYPVVLKIYSLTITHKTDVGGVILNLKTAEEVTAAFNKIKQSVTEKVGAQHFQGVTVQPMVKLKDAYEIIVGSSVDPQFGPVLLFGSGGQMVELFKDRALALPPLNTTLARHLMEQTKADKALKGIRGRAAVDIAAVEKMLVNFSYLVIEQPRIKEIDINPLLASSEKIIALDARVVLHDPQIPDEKLPKPAIRPYPIQYVKQLRTKQGESLVMRPITPEDEPLMIKFHQALSVQTVRNRYFMVMKLEERIAHDRLVRICMNDYDRELALVAERRDAHGAAEIIGVVRLSKIRGTAEAEAAVVVSDLWQNKGIGATLLQTIIAIAKTEKITRITAVALPENKEVQHLFEQKCGFRQLPAAPDATHVFFELKLPES